MKKNLFGFTTVAVLLAMPLTATATTFFADTFDSGSTLNQPVTAPTPTSTSYQALVGLAGGSGSVSPGCLSLTLPNNSGVLGEVLALFTNSPVQLAMVGDYIAISVVFTNANNILSGLAGNNSTLNVGLFYSGGVAPNQGIIQLNTGNTTGGTQGWVGYASRIFWNSGSATIFTRPAQTPNGTTSQNQDLLFSSASSSQAFNNPAGISLGSTTGGAILTQGGTYTLVLTIALTAPLTYGITNTLYAGAGTGGTVIFTQRQTASGSSYVTGAFDGMAIGWRNSSSASQTSMMNISSITISGSVTSLCCDYTIIGPVSVVVATNGSCAFFVDAFGFNLAYQWHRNGINLLDGGNISGATSSLLVISPAGTNDVASGTNGYYVTVMGGGGFNVDSTNVSLTLDAAANLVWSGNGTVWDVATSSNWLNGGVSAAFNYGDNVIFDDTGFLGKVTLTGPFLSASSVTVNSSLNYTFIGSGSIAGPGALIYMGSGPLILGSVNSYSGGTIISNAAAYLVLSNYSALGNGPVTFARAGGMMEVVPTGNTITGIPGDINVADDFTIQFDGVGIFSGVFQGNLSGTPGKTLTLLPNPANTTTNQRIRIYGTNTVYNAELVLSSPVITLANYEASGRQTYNGVISGPGGLVQRGSGLTILSGANTYSGGTIPTTGNIGFGIDSVGSVTSGPIGTGPLLLAPEVPNLTGSGTVLAYGGARTIANPIQYPSATNNLTLIIGGTNKLTFTGSYTLNGNDFPNGTNNVRTLQVDNTGLTTISGVISDTTNGVSAGFSFIKSGTNTLALSNIETYTGPTTVSAGTLQVNGQLNASSVVTVRSNSTLSGTGTINGPITINAGGALAPGAASIGTLTVNNNLTLAGNVNVRVNRSGSTSDKASVSGTLSNSGTGTVVVTNTGAAFQVNDTFAVFNKAVTGGATMKVIGGGVGWSNQLAVNGMIVVSSTNPPTIGTSLSGLTLTLSWPPDYFGWVVQSNSVSLTSTNWFTVPNTGNATSYPITITSARTNVFYRLVQP